MLMKYPSKKTWDLVKLMFHGSTGTDPKLIYESEYGLDNRYSKPGMYGTGIYFADNSSYSFNYQYNLDGSNRGGGLFGRPAAAGGGGGLFGAPSNPPGGGGLFGGPPAAGGGGGLFGGIPPA